MDVQTDRGQTVRALVVLWHNRVSAAIAGGWLGRVTAATLNDYV